jgi:hypothetical protein
MNEDVFNGLGVPVKIGNPDDFLVIKETLERIGICTIPKGGEKTLYQSCHILFKRGQYAIMHFLELFELDGRGKNFSNEDRLRRNLIANRLQEWGLLEIINPELVKESAPQSSITIIPYDDKLNGSVKFVQKYRIGRK